MILWNNWLIIAFLAPMLWALVNLIDVYFVKDIYQDEYDGAIISGFFQIAPWLLVPFLGLSMPDRSTTILALLGGLLFSAAMLFYFKALFITGDVSLIQIFWNLTAILVPILAFIFLKERLSGLQYTGIITTFLGATLLSLSGNIRRNNFSRFLIIISGAIVLLSLSMVVQEHVYQKTEFISGLLFFALGYFIGSLIILNFTKSKSVSYLYQLSKKYFFWFFLIESINLGAIIFSQRAISISPSVSFVAVIESFVPAFVIFFSVLLLLSYPAYSFGKKKVIKIIYREQFTGLPLKTVSIATMAFGIYLISL